jgi:hypothetical protein
MSVTIADCLSLPSLKHASVAGGAEGLDRIVTSISVLEYAEVSALKDCLFVGNELILTAFITAKDDAGLQCQVLRHLYEKGVVGFVLYYVGIFLPKLDERLVLAADELKMPLIIMPENRTDLRYAEVISEVMEAIFYDRLHEKYLVPAIVERIAQYPEHQRTVENILRVISDRFRYSLALTDEYMEIVGSALWPSTTSFDFNLLIKNFVACVKDLTKSGIIEMPLGSEKRYVFHDSFRLRGMQRMYIYVLLEEEDISKSFDQSVLLQISESIQIILSMRRYSDWLKSSDMLIPAILDDNYYLIDKVKRQASVELKEITTMWVLSDVNAGSETHSELVLEQMLLAKTYLKDRYEIVLIGNYEGKTICFLGKRLVPDEEVNIALDFGDEIRGTSDIMILSFHDLNDRYEAQEIYTKVKELWYILPIIYDRKRVFQMQHLNFAAACRDIMQRGETAIKGAIAPLRPLIDGEGDTELLETFSAFLLDAESRVPETAKLLHLHINTIKYRLKAIRNKLHRDITKLPAAYELYLAAAIYKLYLQN